ncbi:RNA polymerase sigma factor [Haloferula rosea]|uniref:Sigma-70 family RNA polymerase sigma factor n=1 Tax=Haloferula rosea TaxID=490093 RepID=A0A934R8D6_9BACT|nr:sigma-70 family RNA polymerase sigma factor [Haloferula rosea]MBK1825848.1 sigma-70 family RNA polymerase sigma factor [Haloferula rosea]
MARTPADPEMVETREQFIERTLAEYESPLIGYAYGFVQDVDRARDVVQDTFIRLCKQDIEKVRDGVKGWLFTVCRNRALDVLRKESRMSSLEESTHERTASASAGPDQVVDKDERIQELMTYIDRLSDNQKTVILMKFRDGLSYHEIADATGLTSGNIGFLIHAGVKRLRQLLPPDLMEGLDR